MIVVVALKLIFDDDAVTLAILTQQVNDELPDDSFALQNGEFQTYSLAQRVYVGLQPTCKVLGFVPEGLPQGDDFHLADMHSWLNPVE